VEVADPLIQAAGRRIAMSDGADAQLTRQLALAG
jgi:hypothetical protein